MKRLVALAFVVAIGVASLVIVQRRHEEAGVSANAVVDMAADVQRDTLRVPMHLTRLSDEEETRIGDEMAQQYLSRSRSADDDAIGREVQRVGGRLAAHAHRRLNYRFHVIEDDGFLNAFALPGGHVFIGTGLIRLMDTEDELAAVLGHEMEHIDHYHCAERVQIEAQARKLNVGILGELAQIPLELFEAGYSKDQEAEADREGLLLAAQADYSPEGAVTMFQKFDRLHRAYVAHAGSPPEELSQIAVGTLIGYFRSHPEPAERVAQAKRVIAEHRLDTTRAQIPLPVGIG